MQVLVLRGRLPRGDTRTNTQALLVFTWRIKLSGQTRMLSEVAEYKEIIMSSQTLGRRGGRKEKKKKKKTLVVFKIGRLRKIAKCWWRCYEKVCRRHSPR